MTLVSRLTCAFLIAFAATLSATASADTFGTGTQQFDIEFVTIGSPGNAADTTGSPNPAGAVATTYRISKFEISEDMVAKANAAGSLAITTSSRGPNKPATNITWIEAAQFVNWLNEDAGHAAAYKFGQAGDFQIWQAGDAGYDAANPYRNAQARYVLPSIDEWYKAAYFDPAAGVYYDFPTGSDATPDGIDFTGDTSFDAVFLDPAAGPGPNDITNVGTLSQFGTAGQGGNVWEWLETSETRANDSPIAARGLRGGGWPDPSQWLRSTDTQYSGTSADEISYGFRVASVVPEPTSMVLLAGSIIGYAVFVRCRRKRDSRPSRLGRPLLSLLALFVITPGVDAAIIAGPITNPANGSRYYLLDDSGWTAAQAEAVTLGGNLATINDAAEQQWVYSTFSTFDNVNRNLWIGLYDPDPATNAAQRVQRRLEFEWVSGEVSSYRNWSPVEPNNPQTTDPENPELFGHIWNPVDPNAGDWNNFRDLATVFGRPVNGVVEVLAVPEPGAMGLLFLGALGSRWLLGRRC